MLSFLNFNPGKFQSEVIKERLLVLTVKDTFGLSVIFTIDQTKCGLERNKFVSN